jgi:F-type H+-transporting ATPase subunit gamma
MPSLRDIKRRITSVKNTKKITRAMKLVATSKLRKATEAALAAKPYQETLSDLLHQVLSSGALDDGEISHPLLNVPKNTSDVLLIVLSTDRGLCGGFNAQLIKLVKKTIEELQSQGKNVELMLYGKKCNQAYGDGKKVNSTVVKSIQGLSPKEFDGTAKELAEDLVVRLSNDQFSQVLLCYNTFQSVMTQTPKAEQVLPMTISSEESDLEESPSKSSDSSSDYLYEPSGEEIISAILPMVLRSQLHQAFLETEAGEQAARMQAMDNATRNAGDLIDRLTLKYNRARQASITKELIEIISGAEAL